MCKAQYINSFGGKLYAIYSSEIIKDPLLESGPEVCLQTEGEVKNGVGSGCQGGSHTQLGEALW